MNAYNPLSATKRLEESGLSRQQTEAIASEITDGTSNLVTKDELNAALDRLLVKVGVMTSGIVAVATGILGVLISIK